MFQPVLAERLQLHQQSVVGHGLRHERIRAQLISARDVARQIRGRKNDRGNHLESGPRPQPLEHLEAVHDRHLQVHENHHGQRIFFAIGEGPVGVQIIHDLLAVLQHLERAVHVDFREGALGEKNVVLVVVHDEDGALAAHGAYFPFSIFISEFQFSNEQNQMCSCERRPSAIFQPIARERAHRFLDRVHREALVQK